MSLRVLYQAQNKLIHIFGLIFLCFAYFHDILIAEPISIFFQISYFLGQVLVNKFLILCKFTVEAVHLIHLFFQVLHEDSLTFINDATEKFIYVLYLIKYMYSRLEELGWICVRGISGIGQGITNLIGILHQTLASLKYGVHLTGSSIWRFLTVTPDAIILNLKAITDFVTKTCKDIITSVFMFFDNIVECLGKMYLFFFDIPLDSIYGLIIGGIVVTVIYIKFHDITVIISSAFVKLYKQIVNLGIRLWTGRFLFKREDRNFEYDPEEDERLCVVCQYHSKEIIIFPCKHLCLCAKCSVQVANIRPYCPICRGRIGKTIKVYM